MAYTDTKARPNGTSVGGAIAINGLMIAGIIFAAPDILPKEPWKIIDTYWVKPEVTPPPPQPVIEKPIKQDAKARPVNPPPARPETSARSNADNGYVAGKQPFTPGTGSTIIEEPPVKIEPVFKGAQVNPRYAGALQPTYPPGMIREEREGVVTVRVLIGTDGRVKQVEPVRSDETAFLDATRRQALGKWRFLPATRDGQPVESWREMTVRFQLPD